MSCAFLFTFGHFATVYWAFLSIVITGVLLYPASILIQYFTLHSEPFLLGVFGFYTLSNFPLSVCILIFVFEYIGRSPTVRCTSLIVCVFFSLNDPWALNNVCILICIFERYLSFLICIECVHDCVLTSGDYYGALVMYSGHIFGRFYCAL